LEAQEVGGVWTDWTPTVTQLVSVAVTVTEAKYKVKDSDVRIYCQLAVTGTGTAGNTIAIAGWPSAITPNPAPNNWPLGSAVIVDTGTAEYEGIPVIRSGSIIAIASPASNTFVGVNPNFALANGDFIELNMYWKVQG
jgi:hypothetical protein